MNDDDTGYLSKTVSFSIPIGALGILTFIVFMILKLCGAVGWSWLIVCIPLIAIGGLVVLEIVIVAIIILVVWIVLWARGD